MQSAEIPWMMIQLPLYIKGTTNWVQHDIFWLFVVDSRRDSAQLDNGCVVKSIT